MKKNITIKARLGITMGILSALLLAIGSLGLYGLGNANGAFRDTYINRMPAIAYLDQTTVLTMRERANVDRALRMMNSPDVGISISRGHDFRVAADAAWKKFDDLPDLPGEQALQDAAYKKLQDMRVLFDKAFSAVKAKDAATAGATADDIAVATTELFKAFDLVTQCERAGTQQAFDEATATFVMIRYASIAAIIAGLVIASLSWLSLRRAIGGPLDDALEHFEAIAAGDLARRVNITSTDEMGMLMRGLAKMQTSLVSTVRTVRSGSDAIASATQQIAAGNLDLSSRTEEQASALQETAASMDQLTSTVKQNADNASQASKLAENASQIADSGSVVVAQVVSTMKEINDSSSKIADIISIIEGIAFQTNILALNAAVEAARAGEQGRGFAVVAGEVRNLAQRSSAAAKEIKGLIHTSVERVQSGTLLVDNAGRTMTDIIGAVKRVTDIMGEIASASKEQSAGIDQVALAVSQMDQATQQNAALVEEAAAAAHSLEDQADKLKNAVAVFQL